MRAITAAALVAVLATASHAQNANRAADEAAIRGVIQAFLDTREAVVSGSLATQQSTGGKRTITVDSLRFVGSDVAIADGRYDSVGRADGTDQRMLTSMVLHREGGAWKIAAIRNMLPSSPQR